MLGAVSVEGNLSRFLQNLETANRFAAVFFKSVALPSGSVAVRRPPAEARAELGKLIQAAPGESELYSLRAMEAEAQLDFAAAEADWKKHVETSSDKAAANLALADYYHRRLQVREELAALNAAATATAYARSIELVDAQALGAPVAAEQYKAWVQRYPKESAVYSRALQYLNAKKQFAAAQEIVAAYKAAFPSDSGFATRAEADIEFARGNMRRAAEIWDQSFDPLWPSDTISRYFDITGAGRDRQLLGRLQHEAAQKPEDLATAAKIHHLQERLNNSTGARRALFELRARKKTWTDREWLTLGRLLERASLAGEAARCYHALYLLSNEQGITELARLLLDMPDQPIAFGAGDLALYRDIATMDQGPGYLNGVLSLILNTEGIPWRFDQQNAASRAYFHRVKAAELVDVLTRRFPAAQARPSLTAKLIQSYATYGDRQGVIRAGKQFLQDFAGSPDRLNVTFLMADAYAATNQVNEELAAYDTLLKELGTASNNVPVGAGKAVRSPQYVRTLDRYVARLVALKRLPQALALYRQEIDRNSNDPGLYERFAVFLEQNKYGGEVEQVYRQAVQKFQDDTWTSKLARWYLRRKMVAQFEAITRDVTRTFSGTSLEKYFGEVVAGSGASAAITLQLNLYANQRFPHNQTFVRNLLNAYETRPTADPAAYERLLRRHWFAADDLRARFFQLLSRTNRLQAELDSLRALNAKPEDNPVAAHLLAEGEIWRTRYEAAAAPMRAMAAVFPADSEFDARAAMLHRSLDQLDAASAIESNLAKAAPRDIAVLTRLGEMQADRERYGAAKPHWEKIPAIEPGKPEGVLETATIYWDYFQFDDAMRTIEAGRKRLGDNTLGGYEAGAIRENQRDYTKAIDEYLRAALSGDEGRSRSRLLRLARRPDLRAGIESAVASRASSAPDDLNVANLRIALFESQNRRADLEAYLQSVVSRTSNPDVIARAEAAASLNGMSAVERRAMERRIELAPDATGQLRARLQFMRFLEARNDMPAATRIVEDAYRQNPMSLGVVRTAVNFFSRNKDPRRAIAILTESAGRAKGSLPASLRLEAARKAVDAGEYTTAKSLIDGLLQAEPLHTEYLAVGADFYARQNDDAGLKAFYAKSIETLRAAKQPVESLRRNLIPVLARQKDFNGAVDQYIEILNRFPEDDSLTREAARFAAANSLQTKLSGFYAKATSDSPKDYRWPLVLSRIQAEYNDLDGALASLSKATGVRPDRTDLMITRAQIEERSLRFEAALESYRKIWELSYRSPAWLEKAAEQHLRLGRTDQAVATLRQAYIDGQPETAGGYSMVARKLLDWNLVKAASEIAPKATADLQAAVAMRLRQPLVAAHPAHAVGSVVAQYYTPKEMAAFGATLRGDRGRTIAEAASMKDSEASLLAATVTGNNYYSLINLQRSRGRLDELGQQLEAVARIPARAGENAAAIRREAARAYRDSGNMAGEQRVLNQLMAEGDLSGDLLNRYALLLVRQPAQAAALAGNAQTSDPMRDALAKASLFAAKPADAFAILAGRGAGRPQSWTSAYTALAGVYLGAAAREPQVKAAFEALLGAQTIGEQLARRPDRNTQLTGKDWFYYAARFGENIPGAAPDYITAEVESSPATASLYVQLGDYYMDRADYANARVEYEYALQLQPKSMDTVRRLALTLYAAGRREEALARWREVLAADNADLRATIDDLALAKVIDPLKPDVDKALRNWLRRSSAYEASNLLRPLASDLTWILDLANAAPDPADVLGDLLESSWLTGASRETVLAATVQSANRRAQSTLGDARDAARNTAARWHAELVQDLITRGDVARASAEMRNLTPDSRSRQGLRYEELAIRIAAAEGKLDALSVDAASFESLQRAAATLDAKAAAQVLDFAYRREIAEYRYSAPVFLGLAKIRLQQGNVEDALNLLRRMNVVVGEPFSVTALAAELLFENNRPQEAREFAEALAKARPWDAKTRLLQARIASSPEPALKAIGESQDVPYSIRCEAALAIRQIKGAPLQSAEPELNLLSSQAAITEQQASAIPYGLEARKLAAAQSKDANARYRLQGGALAIRPEDSAIRRSLFQSAIATRRFQAATTIYAHGAEATHDDMKLLTDAYLRLGRNDEAAETARRLVDARVPGARRLADLAKGALELQYLNEGRMPVFQENYDQDRVVRPRLAALPVRRAVAAAAAAGAAAQ